MGKRIIRKSIRIISAVCTALMLIISAGCAGKIENKPLIELPKLTIGIDEFEPYSFNDNNGMPSGIDVELAREACSRMGYEPVFKYLVWNDKDKNLADGDIDCIWSCFSMNDRQDKYRWTGPYMNSRQAVAVRQESDITKISDLEGRSIAVQSSTKAEQLFTEKHDNIPQVKKMYCLAQKEYVFAALRKGYVDAISGHEYMLRQLLEEEEGKYRLLDESLQLSKLGVAFDKNNTNDIPDKLKTVLKDMLKDGTIAEIAEKYGLDANTALGGITLE